MSTAPLIDLAPRDPFGRDLVRRPIPELLAAFNRAEVLTAADVHVADQLGWLGGERQAEVLLAIALTVRAVRTGSVCLDLATVRDAVVGATTGDPATIAAGDPDLARQLTLIRALDWPEIVGWQQLCRASPLVRETDAGDPTGGGEMAGRAAPGGDAAPLRWWDGRLYLDRYWRQERLVADALDARATVALPAEVDLVRMTAAIVRMFPAADEQRQRMAAAVCAGRRLTVIAGGPGTGKTTAVARMLAVLSDQPGPPPRIALAAPTGKAATRLQQAVRDEIATLAVADRDRLGDPTASTLHRLLGWRPGSRARFRHDRHHHLPFDVVVVDETSMVSLTMMARLMEAVRPDSRLVVVGDPDQLASIEAGAVLGDIVARAADEPTSTATTETAALLAQVCPAEQAALVGADRQEFAAGVARLVHRFRFGGAIAALADAVRYGRADDVLDVLRSGDRQVSFLSAAADHADPALAPFRGEVVAAARVLSTAAMAGDVPAALSAMDAHRLLCAHRRGPFGAAWWATVVQRWIAVDQTENPIPGADPEVDTDGWWEPGRPLLVAENDYELGLFNGDTGVVVRHPERGIVAAFGDPQHPILVRPGRLSGVQSVHAMTIHKSQGSQFSSVTVVLPPAESPLLTRELLYTAATRASEHVRLIGTEEAVRAAVARPVTRASGLRRQ